MLPHAQREMFIRELPEDVQRALPYSRDFWARPEQCWEPGPEMFTAYFAGRGWGKGFTGSHATIYVAQHPWLAGGRKPRGPEDRTYGRGAMIGIAGRTLSDVIAQQVEGPSGIFAWSPPDFVPTLNKNAKLLTWPNGAQARLFSGDVAAASRGSNLGFLWADELAYWAASWEAWSSFKMALRHGPQPRAVITTTPLSIPAILSLYYECDEHGVPLPIDTRKPHDEHGNLNPRTRVVHGSTTDNAANVPREWLTEIVATMTGKLAMQEVHGRLLMGSAGALWKYTYFKRMDRVPDDVELTDIVIAVDPAASVIEGQSMSDGCEVGIVVAGMSRDGRLWYLQDRSGVWTPNEAGDIVVELLLTYPSARVAAERNFGGTYVENNVRAAVERYHRLNPNRRGIQLRYLPLQATRNKLERASLVVGKWEEGRVVHVGDGTAAPYQQWVRLEYQMAYFSGKGASDRLDAAVWAALALDGQHSDMQAVRAMTDVDAWRRAAALASARLRTPLAGFRVR